MMAFAVIVLPAAYTLARALAGERAAQVASLLVAGSPFIQREVYFTWPKLLASAFVILGLHLAWSRRTLLSGFTTGIGYWCHPGALLGIPLVAGIWLARERHEAQSAGYPQPLTRTLGQFRFYKGVISIAVGVAATWVLWRLVNWGNFHQNTFWSYATMAYGVRAPTFSRWLDMRMQSFASTVVPGYAYYVEPAPGMTAAKLVRFFFQYCESVPFSAGLCALPFLATMTYRGIRRHLTEWLLLIILPFLAFTFYWGATNSGMMREGLHVWFLVWLVLVAQSWSESPGPRWASAMLALRGAETLLMMVVPTWLAGSTMMGDDYRISDAFNILLMALGLIWIARETWVAMRDDPKTGAYKS
jgi:hypothetical protein